MTLINQHPKGIQIPIKYPRADNLYKYNSERVKFKPTQIKEKVDGANFRFMLQEGKLVFGSRNVSPLTPSALGGERIDQTYAHYINFVTSNINMDKVKPNHIYFAEALMRHKILYVVPRDKLVLGFDVWDIENRKFKDDWKTLFDEINIPTVHVYKATDFKSTDPIEIGDEINSSEFTLKSEIDGISSIEGIFMCDYENQIMFKAKTESFMETSRSREKKVFESYEERFFQKYGTRYRIEKMIAKMKIGDKEFNKNNPIPSLVGHVLKDIFEEATIKDIISTFGSEIRYAILDKVMSDNDLRKDIISLKS